MRLRIRPKFCILLIVVMLIAFGSAMMLSQRSLKQGEARLAAAISARDALRDEVTTLNDELAFVQTVDYVIRTARNELGMIMPGEIRYVSAQ